MNTGDSHSEATREEAEDDEKIIVRSDGTVTYVGKDIAYQLWKLGLLGLDFRYKPYDIRGDHRVWITTTDAAPGARRRPSGTPAGSTTSSIAGRPTSRTSWFKG